MSRKEKILLLAVTCLLLCPQAVAQRFSVGTNGVDWLTLGTLNLEAGAAVAKHFSVHVGAEYNPWTFMAGDQQKQLQTRHVSYWGGVRWWPWFVYSGWWVAAEARYSMYNLGGIIKRSAEEGDAYGGGIYGGYTIMLTDRWNLDLGVGVWGGYKNYTRYNCPVCGVITEEGSGAFVLPDARIAIMLIF